MFCVSQMEGKSHLLLGAELKSKPSSLTSAHEQVDSPHVTLKSMKWCFLSGLLSEHFPCFLSLRFCFVSFSFCHPHVTYCIFKGKILLTAKSELQFQR